MEEQERTNMLGRLVAAVVLVEACFILFRYFGSAAFRKLYGPSTSAGFGVTEPTFMVCLSLLCLAGAFQAGAVIVGGVPSGRVAKALSFVTLVTEAIAFWGLHRWFHMMASNLQNWPSPGETPSWF